MARCCLWMKKTCVGEAHAIELFRSTFSKSRMGNHDHVQEKESHGTSEMIIIQSKDHNYKGTCRSRVRWGAKERWGGRGESEGTRRRRLLCVTINRQTHFCVPWRRCAGTGATTRWLLPATEARSSQLRVCQPSKELGHDDSVATTVNRSHAAMILSTLLSNACANREFVTKFNKAYW